MSIIDEESVEYAFQYVPSYIATYAEFDRWLEQHDAEVAKATEERIIKLIETQEVEGWFDRGLKQHFIALIKAENATDFTGSTLPISQEGENK